MLIYKDGCFHVGNVSFILPDDIALDTSSDEICGQGFHLHAPDGSFTVQIDCKESENTAYREIEHNFDGQFSYKLIGEIKKITAGGFDGYKAFYEDEISLNEEYAFDLTDCGEYTLLDIYVMIHKNSEDYDETYKNRIVTEILDGIRYN